MRILVVEDETALAAQLQAALEGAGYAVDRAASGDRADYLARTEAYDAVKPYWPLPAVEIDGLANQMNTQWPMVKQRFGTSLAIEFVHTKKVADSFVEYTYLQKFERHALRWVIVLYKPADHWLINAVSWDDSVSLLFE